MTSKWFRAPALAAPAFGLSLASAVALGSPAVALKLGSLAPPDLGGCGNCNTVQRRSAPGQPSYEVPPGKWKIKSWSAQGGGTAAGKAMLRVYRPTGEKNQLKLIRQTSLEKIPADGHPVFKTDLIVRGGDLIGIYTVDNVPAGYLSGLNKDFTWVFACDLDVGDLVGPGSDCKLNPLKGDLVNVEVTLSEL